MYLVLNRIFQYCEDSPFVVESGEVTTPEGQVLTYPTLSYRKEVVETAKVNSLVGNSNLSFLQSIGTYLNALLLELPTLTIFKKIGTKSLLNISNQKFCRWLDS